MVSSACSCYRCRIFIAGVANRCSESVRESAVLDAGLKVQRMPRNASALIRLSDADFPAFNYVMGSIFVVPHLERKGMNDSSALGEELNILKFKKSLRFTSFTAPETVQTLQLQT